MTGEAKHCEQTTQLSWYRRLARRHHDDVIAEPRASEDCCLGLLFIKARAAVCSSMSPLLCKERAQSMMLLSAQSRMLLSAQSMMLLSV
jgi:hypothetical protein